MNDLGLDFISIISTWSYDSAFLMTDKNCHVMRGKVLKTICLKQRWHGAVGKIFHAFLCTLEALVQPDVDHGQIDTCFAALAMWVESAPELLLMEAGVCTLTALDNGSWVSWEYLHQLCHQIQLKWLPVFLRQAYSPLCEPSHTSELSGVLLFFC